ncbi:HNH endonuclease [Bosea sp. ASV33]|uniref:HNH endonuclease n=1 Tax=Bosea sp. ASV33 TaxID=2795106 RepID=UPI0018ED0E55|nr:HNH endonuclease [Bosea sp. ASV33]
MMHISDAGISDAARAVLRGWQDEVDSDPEYERRVKAAKLSFTRRNRKDNPTFAHIRDVLSSMCCGAVRCGYCEDSAADEVEHIAPKSLYPERTFDWANYLYACGYCNRGKNNSFPLKLASGQIVDGARKPNTPVLPPPAGTSLLIDPRVEDPLDYLELDLAGTFRFLPRIGIEALAHERAETTIEVLDLNRGYLLKARKTHFQSYQDRLVVYALRRDGGADAGELDRRREDLLNQYHPSIFEEMKRQVVLDPVIRAAFENVPEALGWVRA